jgi:hypothetical protein
MGNSTAPVGIVSMAPLKKLNIKLSYDPTTAFPSIDPKELKAGASTEFVHPCSQ